MQRSTRWIAPLAAAACAVGLVATAGSAGAATSDPLRTDLWGLDQINAEQSWGESTGGGATVAVVDTGVDLGHPDLAGQLVPGATFSCAEGHQGPCGDGGWKGADGVGQETDAHGTHVAGTIAALADNGLGVAGVAPDAKIMPIKVLEDGSGTNADIAEGIRWAADNGADVINLSLGSLPGMQLIGALGLDTTTVDAIEYARDRGTLTVAAAGNTSTLLCNDPAFNSDSICVGATDRNELKSYFSELPIKLSGKSVAAPGGAGSPLGGPCEDDIISTVPRGTGTPECGGADYDAYAGTSMATPHVAGVAALLSAQGRSMAGVEEAILTTARHPLFGTRGGFSLMYGKGIVDAEAAVGTPVS
ncbi:S8 family serine peptidase [Janibacter cremeus]|uniref:Subtilisin family serine protease n=1 Tax=Janibacter cremeus TaxID=1285192 RepID=A0A852VZE2_9MICO|nr:S8 family serine peptidase [Janibacter cremeus]NYF99085.1 subtilisin family serine protease [Janibacter cremeus]